MKNVKNKFYVYFYDDRNLGDDLFIDILVRRFPQFDFYIYSDEHTKFPSRNFETYSNLHYSKIKFSINNIKSEVEKYSGVILIGGSIFQDLNFSLYRNYISRYLIFKKLIKSNKKVFVMGANLGPFKTLFGKMIFKKIFKYVTYTCVRDSYSFKLLNDWDIKNIDFAPDIIFSYDFKPKCEITCLKNILGISILNTKLNIKVKQDYIKKMAELANRYINTSPDNIVRLFGFDGGHENDGAAIDEVIKLITLKERVIKIEYDGVIEIEKYIDSFVECGFIVGSRFHSIILAAKYKIPFFPIVYSKKTSSVLNDLNYSLGSIEYAEIETLDLNELLTKILRGNRFFSIPESISIDSEKHFSGLDLYRDNKI